MRWSFKRLIVGSAIIFLLVIGSFLSWNRNEFPKYLLEEAQQYFYHHEDHEVEEKPAPHVIQEFLQRPVLTYDEAVQLNSASCPTDGVNFATGSVREYAENWRDISSTKISEWRRGIAAYLQARMNSKSSMVREGQGGRGIVMAAGDHAAVIRARTSIRLLSSYNCTLPVEVFHFQNELSASDKRLISDLNQLESQDSQTSNISVTLRVVKGVRKGNGWKAFEIKGAAIQESSFDEILYLDTDSYLLQDPEPLFDSKYFRETGLLLWPDYTKSHATNPLWRLVGQQCRNEYEGESGQLFISRSRHQDVLWVVEYFAIHHRVFYSFMGGDRDSFRVAALLLGKKWNGPGRLNAAAGVALEDDPSGGGHTMLQADPEGRWMFVHANLIKHGKFPRPLWAKIHRAAQDRYEGTSTYGSIDPPNDDLGRGVRVRVDQEPKLVSTMEVFEGFNEGLVVVEDWDAYEELRGFEEKWFRLGGQH